ncbi:MAG: hypothetical protein GY793_07570 [Proteobacteria bacterium]|nr:hypothetical protein [Pseudomonadota bacterium]
MKQKFVDVFGKWTPEEKKKNLLLAVIFLWPVLMIFVNSYFMPYENTNPNDSYRYIYLSYLLIHLTPGIFSIFFLKKKLWQKIHYTMLYIMLVIPLTVIISFVLGCLVGLSRQSCHL